MVGRVKLVSYNMERRTGEMGGVSEGVCTVAQGRIGDEESGWWRDQLPGKWDGFERCCGNNGDLGSSGHIKLSLHLPSTRRPLSAFDRPRVRRIYM